jgi:negative regulator of sigma E activity
MTNDADNFREMLSAYIDGELSEADARRLELAMQKDASLAGELARLRKVVFMLRHLEREKAGEDFASRVMARAERANLVGASALARHRAARPSLMLKWGLVAAAAVICIAVAAKMYQGAQPAGTGALHSQVALNEHRKDLHNATGAAPPAAPSALAKPAAVEDRAADSADAMACATKAVREEKDGAAGKTADVAKLGKGSSDYSFKVAPGEQEKGATEVLYTANLDEARKNVEQVLACNGVGADTGTINTAQSQFYNAGRNVNQPAGSISQATSNISQPAGNIGKSAGNIGTSAGNGGNVAGNVGQAAGNVGQTAGGKSNGELEESRSQNDLGACNGNFSAVQNDGKQVQYRVLANRSQVPQIRGQISQLRGTNNFIANAADGNLQVANGQFDAHKSGQQGGAGGQQAGNDQEAKEEGKKSDGSQPCQADKSGPQVVHAQVQDNRVPAAPAGNAADDKQQLSQQRPRPADAPQGEIVLKQPSLGKRGCDSAASPAASPAPAATAAPTTRPAGAPAGALARGGDLWAASQPASAKEASSQEKMKSQLLPAQAKQGQPQSSEPLEELLITINVIPPDNHANAAAQNVGDTPASLPATAPANHAAQSR